MTVEYILLVTIGGLVFMSALMKAPRDGFNKGSTKLGARVETQLATGSGFKPYPGTGTSGGDNGQVPWDKKD